MNEYNNRRSFIESIAIDEFDYFWMFSDDPKEILPVLHVFHILNKILIISRGIYLENINQNEYELFLYELINKISEKYNLCINEHTEKAINNTYERINILKENEDLYHECTIIEGDPECTGISFLDIDFHDGNKYLSIRKDTSGCYKDNLGIRFEYGDLLLKEEIDYYLDYHKRMMKLVNILYEEINTNLPVYVYISYFEEELRKHEDKFLKNHKILHETYREHGRNFNEIDYLEGVYSIQPNLCYVEYVIKIETFSTEKMLVCSECGSPITSESFCNCERSIEYKNYIHEEEEDTRIFYESLEDLPYHDNHCPDEIDLNEHQAELESGDAIREDAIETIDFYLDGKAISDEDGWFYDD